MAKSRSSFMCEEKTQMSMPSSSSNAYILSRERGLVRQVGILSKMRLILVVEESWTINEGEPDRSIRG